MTTKGATTMIKTTTTTVDLSSMDARELFAAYQAGVPGAKEAYEKKVAKRNEIKRARRFR